MIDDEFEYAIRKFDKNNLPAIPDALSEARRIVYTHQLALDDPQPDDGFYDTEFQQYFWEHYLGDEE